MSTPLNGSLLKGFEILGLFSRDRPEIGAPVLMAELDMNAATAHRFLATLEEAGAITLARRGVYRLGMAMAELGRLAEETNPLVRQVQPLLDQLAADLGESVMLCRLGRRGPVSVAVAVAQRPFTMGFRVGAVLGLLSSAQGRLWLAEMTAEDRLRALGDDGARDELEAIAPELQAIRAAGIAQNEGHAEPDVGAVAVPVRNGQGVMVLSLSMFGPLGRLTPHCRAAAAPRLMEAARDIGRRMQR